MIEPEVGHHFLKLGAGVDVAGEALGHELFCDEALGIFECAYGLLLAGGEIGVDGDTLHGAEGLDESFKLLGLHGGQLGDALGRGEGQNGGDGGGVELWLGVGGPRGHVRLC